jgi:predicted nucleic acid-binding Zn ribbon protein
MTRQGRRGEGPSAPGPPSLEESRPTVPVYVYRRQDGSTFEIEQRITEDSLVRCPTTGQKVARVLQPFTPRYKGTGFYSTDHRKPKAKEQPKGGE